MPTAERKRRTAQYNADNPDAPKRGRGRPRTRPVVPPASPTAADGSTVPGFTTLPPPPPGALSEWDGYRFLGAKTVVEQKRRLLAQIEGTYEIGPACALVGVPRYKAEQWILEDDTFAVAVDRCRDYCRQRGGSLMFQAGLTPTVTREGNVRVNAQALIMFLNAQDPDYGLIKAQMIERRDTRLVQRACEILEGQLPAEEIERFRRELGRVCTEEMLGTSSRAKEG